MAAGTAPPAAAAAGNRDSHELVLKAALEEAKPDWSEKSILGAVQRLRDVGVLYLEDLRQAVEDGTLNGRLRQKNLKTFTSDTLDEFRRYLGLPEKQRGDKKKLQAVRRLEATCGNMVGHLQSKSSSDAELLVVDAVGQVVVDSLVTERKKHIQTPKSFSAQLSDLTRQKQRLANGKAAAGSPQQDEAGHDEKQRQEDAEVQQSRPKAPSTEPKVASTASAAPLLGDALIDAAAAAGIPVSRLEENEEGLYALYVEWKRVHNLTLVKLQAVVAAEGCPVETHAGRAQLRDMAKDFLLWKAMKMPYLRSVCVEKIGVNVSDDLTREQLLQLIKNASWEAKGIPVTRLKCLDDAQEILDEVDRLSEISSPVELLNKCKTWGIANMRIPESGIEVRFKKMLQQAFIWNRMPVAALRRECQVHGVSIDASQGTSKVASEHFMLMQALIQCLGTNAWMDRGIPRERFHGDDAALSQVIQQMEHLEVVSDLHLLAECRHRDVPIHPNKEDSSRELLERLRWDLIRQNLPEEELQKECEQAGIEVPLGTTRAAMVEALNERQRYRDELEARAIPAEKFASLEEALEVIELHRKVDEMDDAELLEWYSDLGFPQEAAFDRKDAQLMYKAIINWNVMMLPELLADAVEKGCVEEAEVDISDEPEMQRSFLINKLMGKQRMELWDKRGFQATRIGELQVVCKIVDQFAGIEVLSDTELLETYGQAGLLPEMGMSREEQLHMLKSVLIWEALPMEELERECSDRGAPVELSSLEPDEDVRTAVFQRLTALERLPAWEAAGFEARRIGDPLSVSYIVACYQQFLKLSDAELEEHYRSAGLSHELGMTREATLSILKGLLIWQEMSHKELSTECLQKRLPVPSSASREDMVQLLIMDRTAQECVSCYEQRGIPATRFSSHWIAYDLARRFDEFDGMSVEELREAHNKLNLEAEADMPREELVQRLMDVSVWQALPIEDLHARCEEADLKSPMDNFELSRLKADEEHQYLLSLLCGYTYDPMKRWKKNAALLEKREPPSKQGAAPAYEKVASKQEMQFSARLPQSLAAVTSAAVEGGEEEEEINDGGKVDAEEVVLNGVVHDVKEAEIVEVKKEENGVAPTQEEQQGNEKNEEEGKEVDAEEGNTKEGEGEPKEGEGEQKEGEGDAKEGEAKEGERDQKEGVGRKQETAEKEGEGDEKETKETSVVSGMQVQVESERSEEHAPRYLQVMD